VTKTRRFRRLCAVERCPTRDDAVASTKAQAALSGVPDDRARLVSAERVETITGVDAWMVELELDDA